MSDGKRGINAFGGNMPFLGGTRISTQYGDRYAEWLTEIYGSTGHTDYVGYFFHRAVGLMAPQGSIGFIATNAIADGDNRRTVLGRLLAQDPPLRIHGAETAKPWPGNAQVLVSTLFLERGLLEEGKDLCYLDGRRIEAINSRLRSGNEWPEPEGLAENAGLALVGCFLRGTGFILQSDEANALLDAHPEEADIIRPFLTGDDLNNTVDQRAQRFVIDFRDMSLEEARKFPCAFAIVEERVRPGRELLKTTGADADHRKHWWQFANVRKDLRKHASRAPRLLATARVSKHSAFAFVPATWTPSEQVVVFPLPTWTAFAVLQSRVHSVWLELQGTHMGEGLRYSATECFAPFPFPERDPRAGLPALEALGQRLHEVREGLMHERQIGLTQAYNLLAGPSSSEADVTELQEIHRELDHAVLAAYGWADLAVPPFGRSDRDFEDALGGRLFGLNAHRRTPVAGPGPSKARSRTETKPPRTNRKAS